LERFVVPPVALGLALAAVLVAAHVEPPTAYAGVSAPAYAADLGAGAGLLAAGALAWITGMRRVGVPALLAGVAWLGADFDAWGGGPSIVRSFGATATYFLPAVLLHLVVASSPRRPVPRGARAAVAVAYAFTAVVAFGHAVVDDPFLDPYCWRNCTDNAFLVHADPSLARTLTEIWTWLALAIAALVAAGAAWRLVTASRAARRVLGLMLAALVFAGAAQAAHAIALIAMPLEDPRRTAFAAAFYVQSLSLAVLAASLAWTVVRARRAHAAVARLAVDLGEAPPPGRLRETLAAATGDPALQVAYWLPDDQSYVDSAGRSVQPFNGAEHRAATPIVRAGQPIAVVVHDAALLDGPGLEREIGSAARLAVDNERLQAEVLSQIEELRASRARIVEAADSERRTLERDLHDGAQQRLLALSYDLRLAQAGAHQDGAMELATHLERVAEQTRVAHAELRELAQGIYPMMLGEAGLAAAIATLAEAAPLPVETDELVTERLPAPVEMAAYRTVDETIADAHERRATHARISTHIDDAGLVVSVVDDGVPRTSAFVHLADRIGALGGTLDTGPQSLRAEIPCA
jgi:signal transduction histidine kinase